VSDGWRGARPLPPRSDSCPSADADRDLSNFSELSVGCGREGALSLVNAGSSSLAVAGGCTSDPPGKVLGSGTSGRLRFPDPAGYSVGADPDGFVTAHSTPTWKRGTGHPSPRVSPGPAILQPPATVKVVSTRVDAEYESWDETISHVVQADRDLKVAELRLRNQVAVARRAGHSWAVIGSSLGISHQAARQRFGSAEGPGS